jgi:hypothetical protein
LTQIKTGFWKEPRYIITKPTLTMYYIYGVKLHLIKNNKNMFVHEVL